MQIRNLFVAIACMAVIGFVAEQSQAQRPNNLFSQYYTQGASQVHAEMYPAPHPVPRHVGSAYYTYQPLMPHEHMYAHSREYYNYYATPASFYCGLCDRSGGGYGVTKTSVRWQSGCNAIAPLGGTLQPFNQLQSLLNRRNTVPNGLLYKLMSCQRPSLFSALAGGCRHRDSGCGFDEGCPSCGGYDSDCSTCQATADYAAQMAQARREAAAHTANAIQNRYSR